MEGLKIYIIKALYGSFMTPSTLKYIVVANSAEEARQMIKEGKKVQVYGQSQYGGCYYNKEDEEKKKNSEEELYHYKIENQEQYEHASWIEFINKSKMDVFDLDTTVVIGKKYTE